MAFEFLAVHGCLCSCDKGTTPATLNVIASTMKVDSKNAAVISDKLFTPPTVTFVYCSVLVGPCAIATPGNWSSGAANNKIDGTKCLRKPDTLACTVGGSISISNAGQANVKGE